MNIETKAIRFFMCPECRGGEFRVEHLLEWAAQHGRPQPAGPWYCDNCGAGWNPTAHPDGTVTAEPAGKRQSVTSVLLRVPPNLPHPIWFLVEGMHFDDREFADGDPYFYNEHNCPRNWLRHVERVKVGDDTDPHGFAQYVATFAERPSEADIDELIAKADAAS